MKKIIYWLKKVGMIRSGFYSAKGSAKKMVEMEINSELYQSNKEIDKEHKEQTNKKRESKIPQKNNNYIGKVFLIIFGILAIFFFFAFWGSGWSFWTILGVVLWGFFLKWLWDQSQAISFNAGKILVFGAILIIVSFVIPTPKGKDSNMPTNATTKENAEKKVSTTDKTTSSTVSALEDGVENDLVAKLLLDIEKYMGLTFSKIQNADNVVWPSQNVQLQLQKSKSFSVEGLSPKDFDKLKSYFTNNGATTGGLGFTFVPPVGTQSSGFALTQEPYQGMMCVIVGAGDNGVLIGCGWGPAGNPDEK